MRIENPYFAEKQNRIPDAAYQRRVARAEWAYNHRNDSDPMEGFVEQGEIPAVLEIITGSGQPNIISNAGIKSQIAVTEDPFTDPRFPGGTASPI